MLIKRIVKSQTGGKNKVVRRGGGKKKVVRRGGGKKKVVRRGGTIANSLLPIGLNPALATLGLIGAYEWKQGHNPLKRGLGVTRRSVRNSLKSVKSVMRSSVKSARGVVRTGTKSAARLTGSRKPLRKVKRKQRGGVCPFAADAQTGGKPRQRRVRRRVGGATKSTLVGGKPRQRRVRRRVGGNLSNIVLPHGLSAGLSTFGLAGLATHRRKA
jgi:hypothetical protein